MRRLLAFTALVALSSLVCLPAQAQYSLLTTRPAVGANDFIDWSSLGTEGTTVANPTTSTTDGGVSYTVSQPVGDLVRFDQSSVWVGNFAPGAALLFTDFQPGPLTIDFGSDLLLAGGVQIQGNFGNFTATIEALDSVNNVVFSSSLAGVMDGDSDDSAIFIGVQSTGPAFAQLRFSASGDAFAINTASLRLAAAGTAPEPASLALLGLALPVAGLVRRRKSA